MNAMHEHSYQRFRLYIVLSTLPAQCGILSLKIAYVLKGKIVFQLSSYPSLIHNFS